MQFLFNPTAIFLLVCVCCSSPPPENTDIDTSVDKKIVVEGSSSEVAFIMKLVQDNIRLVEENRLLHAQLGDLKSANASLLKGDNLHEKTIDDLKKQNEKLEKENHELKGLRLQCMFLVYLQFPFNQIKSFVKTRASKRWKTIDMK